MPSVSKKQQRFMGMELAEQRKTGHNKTGMSGARLSDFARGPVKRRVKERKEKSR